MSRTLAPRTLYEKIWEAHVVVAETAEAPAVLYIDMHFTHEVSSPVAFSRLQSAGIPVRRADRTLATLDHSTPTRDSSHAGRAELAAAEQVRRLEENARVHDIELLGLGDPRRGIVHVIGPELGLTQPGMTIVCGDSHTSTHGAFGALAFGIGTTEVAHVLATQCLLQRKAKSFEVRVEGALPFGVTAKDLILAIIHRVGAGGGTGHVFEYGGSTIRALSMEERMTVCNMSIEAGARAGLMAPDETTFAYIAGRPRAPTAADFDRAVGRWRTLTTDAGATFDASVTLDAATLEPMITWGTNPGMSVPIDGRIPHARDDAAAKSLDYMGFRGGEALIGKRIDVVFIGSCTNGRMEDLRAAARVLDGRKVAPGVHLLMVPGSQQVKREAEAAGLAKLFVDAGADWRESGCSMCLGMNGDTVVGGNYCVSTSNRNFEGRQGAGARTLLASPLTAAACAVTGRITDPREML